MSELLKELAQKINDGHTQCVRRAAYVAGPRARDGQETIGGEGARQKY